MPSSTNTDETWSTRNDAARDLSVILGESISVNTLMSWLRIPECPLPKGRGPIPKEELTLWAQTRRRQRSASTDDNENTLRIQLLEEQVRNLKGKNEKLYEESINAADTRSGIARAVEDLKRTMMEEIPSRSWAASQSKTLDEAAPEIRLLIAQVLNTFQNKATPK